MSVPNMKAEEYCPRCGFQRDDDDYRCGFCQWFWSDPGIECICGYINPENEKLCKCCKRLL